MNVVLTWVKKNVFIVVFVALMVAALATLPLLSAGLNSDVQEEVKKRARKAGEMKSLATEVSFPGLEPQKSVINQRLLDQYEKAANAISEDARRVVTAAVEHNRKGRGVLMPRLLPEPPMELAQILPQQFHNVLIESYEDLLQEVGAGVPPLEEAIQAELDRVEAQIRSQVFLKDLADSLDPEEQATLKEKLAAERLSLYGDAATKILFYCTLNEVNVPFYDVRNPPSLTEIYHWQWQLWITQDILKALSDANAEDQTVLRGPVKRVMYVQPWSFPVGAPAQEASSGRGRRSGGDEGGATAGPPDPKKPVPLDFAVSFTGRKSNPLYDVQMVNLGLVVDSNRIPEVLDALARQNFMTVTSLEVLPADPFDDARFGYLYGRVPVSILRMQVETIWLREWTSQFMPPELKRGLGIPDGTPTSG